MINVPFLLELQARNIVDWHSKLVCDQQDMPWNFIEENNNYNFLLWHEEDIARIADIDSLRIVQAKRNIDKYNQARNNAMEKIDEWVLNHLQGKTEIYTDKLHSETPGMMIDRLSILALKRYHMMEEALRLDASEEHRQICMQKSSLLEEQIEDLGQCLKQVLGQLEAGALRFKVYRQMKMYNDPSLNPELYNRKSTSNA